jgi:hypothetical protein
MLNKKVKIRRKPKAHFRPKVCKGSLPFPNTEDFVKKEFFSYTDELRLYKEAKIKEFYSRGIKYEKHEIPVLNYKTPSIEEIKKQNAEFRARQAKEEEERLISIYGIGNIPEHARHASQFKGLYFMQRYRYSHPKVLKANKAYLYNGKRKKPEEEYKDENKENEKEEDVNYKSEVEEDYKNVAEEVADEVNDKSKNDTVDESKLERKDECERMYESEKKELYYSNKQQSDFDNQPEMIVDDINETITFNDNEFIDINAIEIYTIEDNEIADKPYHEVEEVELVKESYYEIKQNEVIESKYDKKEKADKVIYEPYSNITLPCVEQKLQTKKFTYKKAINYNQSNPEDDFLKDGKVLNNVDIVMK